MKKEVLKMVASVAIKSAKKAGNCASIMGLHEPKEPKNLAERLAKMSK